MKGKNYIFWAFIQAALLILLTDTGAADLWRAPFDTTGVRSESDDSRHSLDHVLNLVAAENPSFKSFRYRIQAAAEVRNQAGLWSNPEIEMEIEEFGGDRTGFDESEFTIALSQEFEIFGQRGARKRAAGALLKTAEWQVRLAAFDLYLETKRRFYALAHGQQESILRRKSVELTEDIVENIKYRLDRGAALKSELTLASLEAQQAQLELDQSRQDVLALETALVSLWKAKPSGIEVSFEPEVEINFLLDRIANLSNPVDSSRAVLQLQNEINLLTAERNSAIADARPAVTLSGGIKRFEIDNSRSFLFGISLPVPIFNRNQGTRKSMEARIQSMKYEQERVKNEIQATVESLSFKLTQLRERHTALNTKLLPTAQEAYGTLRSAYDAGRIPYTQLLEAKRILNDLSFEHNDLILAIHEKIIELESLTGAVMLISKEK